MIECQSLDQFMNSFSQQVEGYIGTQMSKPSPVNEAIRYSMEGLGKKVRPTLVMLAAETFGEVGEATEKVAMVLEMIHTYSLIHDDLPCMDNDDMRRGRPTVHRAFDQAQAVLAGDGLLADAFEIVSRLDLPADIRVKIVRELAMACGSRGMVQGQSIDMSSTDKLVSFSEIENMHFLKTAKLLGTSVVCGILSVGVDNSEILKRYRKFGENIGLAFQAYDDLIDQFDGIGKTAGKDHATNKATMLQLVGENGCVDYAKQKTEEALIQLQPEQPRSLGLAQFSEKLLERRH